MHRALVPMWVPPLILVGLIGLGVLIWQLLVTTPVIVLGDDILQAPVAQATQAPQPTLQAPVVQPTQAPVATATVPPAEPMATATMAPTQVPSAGGAVAINGEPATVITALDDSGQLLLADVGGILQRSEDGGMTWTEAGPTPQGRILAAINNPDVLYAGDNPDCDTGEPVLELVRSTDGGLTWSEPLPGWQGMRPFFIEARDPDFLVTSNCAPHFSPDGAVTLEGVDASLGGDQFVEGDVVSVAANRTDSPDLLAMTLVDNDDIGTLVFYTLGDPADGPILPSLSQVFDGAGVVAWSENRVYLATDRGIFASEDNGVVFSEPQRDGLTEVTLNTTPRGTFFDPADQGKNVGFSAIVVNPDDPLDLFITGREGVYRSTDGGLTWTQVAEMREVQSLAVAFEADRFYASDGVTTRSWTLEGQ